MLCFTQSVALIFIGSIIKMVLCASFEISSFFNYLDQEICQTFNSSLSPKASKASTMTLSSPTASQKVVVLIASLNSSLTIDGPSTLIPNGGIFPLTSLNKSSKIFCPYIQDNHCVQITFLILLERLLIQ